MFFFSSRRRHTRWPRDWSSDVCSSDLMERFVAFLIEEYKGVFPVWLAPVQTKIIPVSLDAHGKEAEKLADTLRREGIRVEIDQREEKIGYKIREAQTQKIPLAIEIGRT